MFQAVGTGAVKKENKRKKTPQQRSVHLKVDVPLLVVSITLGIIGLLMVYSASWDYSFQLFGTSTQIFQRQVLWLVIGMVAAGILVFVDYRI